MFRDASAALEALADAMLERLRAKRAEDEPIDAGAARGQEPVNGDGRRRSVDSRARWSSRHRWSTMVLAMLLVATVMPAALAAGGAFADDDGSAHEANIELVADAGITLGCGSGLFCPNDPVTRGQMASFVVRALGYVDDGGGDLFGDDDGTTHEANINRLAAAGVTLGCSADGLSFCPGDPVTRGQMASFIVRAFHYDVVPVLSDHFVDDDGTTHEANINLLFEAGVTQGCSADGLSFCPGDPVTRAQMASFLARALKLPWPTDHSDHPDIVPEMGDRLGDAVVIGDFNADGWDDIAIGIWGENGSEGAVRIVYGTAGGPTGTTQFFTDADFGETPQAYGVFGRSLAVGDFDDDGHQDLAIGANDPAAGDVGRVMVARGGSLGLTPDGELHRSFTGSGAPSHMVAGQFGRGPADELALGYPFAAVGGIDSAGRVEVVYPASPGAVTATKYHQDFPGVGGAAEEGDRFGASLAAGDLTGDGLDELVVGVPFEDLNVDDDEIDVGVVHVFYGSETEGLLVDRGTSPELIHQGDIGAVNEKGDHFGSSIAVGDLDGEGIGDLIVGASGEDLESPILVERRGNVHIIPGSGNGPVGSDAFDLDSIAGTDQPLEPISGLGSRLGFIGGVQPKVVVPRLTNLPSVGVFLLHLDRLDYLPTPLLETGFVADEVAFESASGDMNGDDLADLVLGSWIVPVPAGPASSDAGGVAVWFGRSDGSLQPWAGGLIQ